MLLCNFKALASCTAVAGIPVHIDVHCIPVELYTTWGSHNEGLPNSFSSRVGSRFLAQAGKTEGTFKANLSTSLWASTEPTDAESESGIQHRSRNWNMAEHGTFAKQSRTPILQAEQAAAGTVRVAILRAAGSSPRLEKYLTEGCRLVLQILRRSWEPKRQSMTSWARSRINLCHGT